MSYEQAPITASDIDWSDETFRASSAEDIKNLVQVVVGDPLPNGNVPITILAMWVRTYLVVDLTTGRLVSVQTEVTP